MKLERLKAVCFVALMIALPIGLSGCCSKGGLGTAFGQRDAIVDQEFVSAASTSQDVLAQYRSDATVGSATRTAANVGSGTRTASNTGSGTKNCGST